MLAPCQCLRCRALSAAIDSGVFTDEEIGRMAQDMEMSPECEWYAGCVESEKRAREMSKC